MPNENKDYYKILGVDKNASQDEIKSSYRKLAKLYHPDLHPGDEGAAAKFKEVNEAYETLSDPNKRANYDQFGTTNPNDFFGRGGGFGDFSSGNFSGFEDIFDIFSSFGGGRGARSEVEVPGEDIEINLNLTFKEAVFGCNKTVKVNIVEKCKDCNGTGAKFGTALETCPDCHGSGQVRFTKSTIFGQMSSIGPCKTCNATGKIIKEKCSACNGRGTIRSYKDITIKVPAGIDDNQIITMRGKGNASLKSGPNGDLVINVRVEKHTILEREGFNLLLDLPLPFTTAYLGGEVEIPLAEGTYTLKIPPLTQPNTIFKIKNKGVKMLNKDQYGDLIVTCRIELPKDISKRDKELVESLKNSYSINSFKKVKEFNDKMQKLKK